jgi:ribokinase
MARRPRIAVVGHVEWVSFALGEVPAAGAIAMLAEPFAAPAGGGAVSAVVLARLGAETTFYTALGSDEPGERSFGFLRAAGVDVRAARRPEPQTQALTILDAAGERTIMVVGGNLQPRLDDPLGWDELATADAVYFTGGDTATLAAARAARIVLVTARRLGVLAASGVPVDCLVGSAHDPGERLEGVALDPPPALVVETTGAGGGRWRRPDGSAGSWAAAPLPGPPVDAYGAGDSFVAGLAFGLASGAGLDDALVLAAREGAAAVARRGPYGAGAGSLAG